MFLFSSAFFSAPTQITGHGILPLALPVGRLTPPVHQNLTQDNVGKENFLSKISCYNHPLVSFLSFSPGDLTYC